jgi:Lar family restriction alleviation protein
MAIPIGWKLDNELLPCPFCGGQPGIRSIGNDYTKDRGFDVKCLDCRMGRSDRVKMFSLEWLRPKVVEGWNRRAR